MNKKYAKVDGYPNLLRDLDTNAIINTDSISALNYDRVSKSKKTQKDEIDQIKNDLNDLKKSIMSLTNLVKELKNESR